VPTVFSRSMRLGVLILPQEGHGIMWSCDGSMYSGQWSNSHPNGLGVHLAADGAPSPPPSPPLVAP
jgi:hypothetical protein